MACAYSPFFDTNDGRNAAAASPEPTRPFRIAPPWHDGRVLEKGDAETVRLTLVGKAVASASLCLKALSDAGRSGIGPDRGVLRLDQVTDVPVDAALPDGEDLIVSLQSPLRITVANRLVRPDEFAPSHLLMTLLRRVTGLVRLNAETELTADFGALKAAAAVARFDRADLRWTDWSRHSARQGRLVPMGGIMGHVSVSMAAVDAFRPFLAAAPWLGVGKGTTMGLGSIAFEPAWSPS
jgi:hypothetical protein